MKNEETKKEEINYISKIIEPHDVVSREATEKDIPRIIEDSKILYNLCFTQFERYAGALAMAHPQITKEDPLRLFVLHNKEIVINPKIERHTRTTVDSREGCITFYHLPQANVQRYHRMEVSYITINKEGTGFTDRRTIDVSGKDAFVWQHEIDHLDSKYIWGKEYSRETMLKQAREQHPEMFSTGYTGPSEVEVPIVTIPLEDKTTK